MHTPLRQSLLVCTVAFSLVACTQAAPENDESRASSSAATRSSAAQTASSVAPSPVPSAAASSRPAAVTPPSGSVATLAVPFAPQAPFANWDELHEETCEEVSLIMVRHFLSGESLSEQKAEDELQELVSWMTDNGYGWDVTVSQLAEVAEAKYGLDARVITNVTIDKIIAELSAGRPVIIPAAGRELGNPYFSGAGPWYHMLVITGYKKGAFGARFVTNDPGTKRGAGYEYDANVLFSAIHDWTGVKEETNTGPKNVLVID